jgi:hypothetical protein
MILDEAIKKIELIKLVYRTLFPPEEQSALSLGIEALKRIKANRTGGDPLDDPLLPGETEK